MDHLTNKSFNDITNDAKHIAFETKAFINGKYVASKNNATFKHYNPANGQLNATITECHTEDVDLVAQHAKRTFEEGVWSNTTPTHRKKILFNLAQQIEKHQYELALLDTIDNGMTITNAYHMDVQYAANCFRWYAEAIDKVYDQIAPTNEDNLFTITKEPIGVVGTLTAWNVPLCVAAIRIAPALACGNSVLTKPAEQASLSLIKLGQLAHEAGIPAGVFNVIPGRGEITGKALSLNPSVDCIAFTGSTSVGKLCLKYSAESNMKKVYLECGGKSPNIVFADCYNLDQVATASAQAMFYNQGEICVASSRLLVEESIADAFIEKLIAQTKNFYPMNPLDPRSKNGAIVDKAQFDKILHYIALGSEEGATLLCGGKPALTETGGYFIEPTIFTHVKNYMKIAQDEIFGPVLSIMTFKNAEEAVKLANDTTYGLAASIWTSDLRKAHLTAKKIKAGIVRVNAEGTGGLAVPFGGYKQSGIGRNLYMHLMNLQK